MHDTEHRLLCVFHHCVALRGAIPLIKIRVYARLVLAYPQNVFLDLIFSNKALVCTHKYWSLKRHPVPLEPPDMGVGSKRGPSVRAASAFNSGTLSSGLRSYFSPFCRSVLPTSSLRVDGSSAELLT